jgi:chromosome segregation ATPase
VSDFAPRFGLALIVVAIAIAAIIISRRNYAKAAIVERTIDAFRLEFQHAIDAAQAATIKGVAKTIRDSISSVVRPIDSTMRELDARLARLEQQANAAAGQLAQAQSLDVRLSRLEEQADAGAIRNLEARFAGLEKHTEATSSQIAGTQRQALEENERIAARVIGLEQKLTALNEQLSSIKQAADAATLSHQENLASLSDQQQNLTELGEQLSSIKKSVEGAALREQDHVASLGDQQQNLTALSEQLSLIKQRIDDATVREQEIKTTMDGVSSRLLSAQTRLDELFPRLLISDKARQDQGALIGLLVKRAKKLNAALSEMTARIGDLENSLRAKANHFEKREVSIDEASDASSTGQAEDQVNNGKGAEGIPIEAKTGGQNGGLSPLVAETKESLDEKLVEKEGVSDDNRADQLAT